MTLTLVGTRGEIEARTSLHEMHTALLVSHRGRRVMIDCGLDWLGRFQTLRPEAIVLTHAHPDHAWGLQEGADCPVFAPERTWATIEKCRIEGKRVIELRNATTICGINFEPFAVEHSIRAPAVGYRVSVGNVCVFYVPDVVFIPDRSDALRGVRIYIGDGATISRSLVRRTGKALVGHAPIRTQLGWCEKEKVSRAIFTHCGSEIVEGDALDVEQQVVALGKEHGIDAQIAYDGFEPVLK